MTEHPAIDIEQLSEILGTDEEVTLSEMLTLFVECFPPMLPPLDNACKNENPVALHDAAHAAKSASSSVAAPRLTMLLKSLEINASNKNWVENAATIEDVKSEFDLILQFCRNRQVGGN